MGGGTPPQWLVDFLAAVGLDDIAAGVVAIVGGVVAVWLFTKRVWPVVRAIPAAVVTFARGVVTTAQVLESVKDAAPGSIEPKPKLPSRPAAFTVSVMPTAAAATVCVRAADVLPAYEASPE